MNLDDEIAQLKSQIEAMRRYGNKLAIYAADQLFGIENTARSIKEAIDEWGKASGS